MKTLRFALLLLVGLVLVACAADGPENIRGEGLHAAVDLPDHFLISTDAGTVEPTDDGSCHSPLVDPRTGTNLTMVRSANGMGDYSVPAGQYGLRENELLRITCATGVAVGIVRR